jgi:hypothetical protein
MAPKKDLNMAYFLLFCLIAIAVLPYNVHAQTGNYTLTFKILEAQNREPLPNAAVSISGPVSESKLSGPDGLVIFSDIPAGDYSVVANAPGYAVKSSELLTLNSDITYTLLFSRTKAFFDYKPSVIKENDVVYFNASQSNSSGVITDYEWDFGDNTTGSDITTSHIFVKSGVYIVSLTVTSTVGVATYTQALTVITTANNNYAFLLVLVPLPLLIFWLYRRRKYYVVIQARLPPSHKHFRCPGDDSECENCNLTPC